VRHWLLPPYGDQPSLEAFAANVAHGHYYGTRGAYWPPAFVFFAGFVERFFGTAHAYLAVRTADAAVSALCAGVTADLGRRLLRSAEAGLAAGVLFALYAPSVYYADAFLAVTVGTAAFAAAADAIAAYADAPSMPRLLLAGALLGLGALSKPTELPLIVPGFIHWALRRPGPRGGPASGRRRAPRRRVGRWARSTRRHRRVPRKSAFAALSGSDSLSLKARDDAADARSGFGSVLTGGCRSCRTLSPSPGERVSRRRWMAATQAAAGVTPAHLQRATLRPRTRS